MLKPGDPLPKFSFQAAVSGKAVDNALVKGKRAVLMVHTGKDTETPKGVARVVREKWPDANDVVLASVIDLRAFAGMWRRVAEAKLKESHGKLSAKAQQMGLDPAEHVLLVADWDGTAAATLGVDPAAGAAVVVAGRDGKVLGVATGDDVAGQVVRLLS
jgi:hypothetical protein